ncbi:MAG: ATP-binding protein [Bacillota bacterium]|nr:ATP-binding protein [Bacillota bacterium]
MFVGRKDELSALEKLYARDSFQLVVMYGRRRVGKTTLINEFIKNKPSIFFVAGEANDFINIEMFSQKIYGFFDIPLSTGSFKNWADAFDFIAEKAKEKRFILVIDEFPYAASGNKSLKSILQNVIDHKLKNTNLFMILCGSQISFMENDVLGYKSPLFGRRTAQLKIEGFDYYDAARLMTGYGNEDKIKLYSCIGGTPHYLSQIDHSLSFEDNMKELYFNVAGYLYDEPMMLLQQELREPAMYNSIISAIASGASRLNDISARIGEDTAKTIKYINTLLNLKILRKEFPFGDNPANSRKGIYKISDNCYSFWYRFIFPNKPGIEQGVGGVIAEKNVFPNLPAYIGKPPFEDICRQYVIRQNRQGRLPFIATDFGCWWGNDHKEKKQADVDVVADSKADKKILLGECKWRNNLDDVSEIKALMEKTYLFPGYEEYYFMLFSKMPYSDAARRLEETYSNLKLVTLDMLFEE